MHHQNATRRLAFIVSGLEIISLSGREADADHPEPADILKLKPEEGRRHPPKSQTEERRFYIS